MRRAAPQRIFRNGNRVTLIARFDGNRRLARAQAAFVALLYVFLCTFGTLTHTHAWLGGEAAVTESVVAPAVSPSGGATRVAARNHCASPHCAFCDWQANSVSTALALQHGVAPRLVALPASLQIVIPVTIRIVQTSSRAPPLA
jgi:hypothetical protein